MSWRNTDIMKEEVIHFENVFQRQLLEKCLWSVAFVCTVILLSVLDEIFKTTLSYRDPGGSQENISERKLLFLRKETKSVRCK